MGYYDRTSVSDLLGKTLASIDNRGDELLFVTTDGETYRMHHEQDCCESVHLAEVVGDLSDLVGAPIVLAAEVSNEEPDPGPADKWDESYTWTFYRFATQKGTVVLRWYGTSNGYYSESVDFERVPTTTTADGGEDRA